MRLRWKGLASRGGKRGHIALPENMAVASAGGEASGMSHWSRCSVGASLLARYSSKSAIAKDRPGSKPVEQCQGGPACWHDPYDICALPMGICFIQQDLKSSQFSSGVGQGHFQPFVDNPQILIIMIQWHNMECRVVLRSILVDIPHCHFVLSFSCFTLGRSQPNITGKAKSMN
jgi:hypothetical protein